MTYDPTTSVTDNVSDNLAQYHNELVTAASHTMSASAYSSYVNAVSMTGNVTLTDADYPIQSFSPTAARDLTLPAVASTNHSFYVVNRGSYDITIKNSGGTTVYSLSSGKSVMLVSDGANGWYVVGGSVVAANELPTGYLYGLTLSNNVSDATNDIDIATGKCRDSTDAVDMALAAALTKRLDASWAVGTNQGGLDTGSIANTTYHIWLIKRSDTGVVDALFSTSASSPTMPANYDYKRRIGSIIRSGGAILAFVQDDDYFFHKTPINDLTTTNPGTSAVTRTLTVPVGIRVRAIISVYGSSNSGAADNPKAILINDLSLNDVTLSGGTAFSIYVYSSAASSLTEGATVEVYTNTSAQVRSKVQVSTANTGFILNTVGWVDKRGRV